MRYIDTIFLMAATILEGAALFARGSLLPECNRRRGAARIKVLGYYRFFYLYRWSGLICLLRVGTTGGKGGILSLSPQSI